MKDYLIFIRDMKNGIISVIAKYLKFKNFKTIYKESCNYSKIYYKIAVKFHLPLIRCFFDSWKKERNNEVKNVILFDSGYNNYTVKSLKKSYPNANIILYYWNSVNCYNIKFLEDKNVNKFFTFDKNDADNYNIKYNPQFYTKNIKLKKSLIKYDMLFIGRAKNRKEYLLKTKDIFEGKGFNPQIIIIENERDFISYEEYLRKLSKSKTILDVVEGEQIGLTIRCMESLFLKKKLITNNKDIANYNFYNPNNIFILGVDDMSKINEFINSPYEKVDEEIINYYDFESWLKRFEENQNEH